MSKLATFFLFIFIGSSILGGIMNGGGGILAVKLAAPVDADATTITVASTQDFLDSDYLVIGTEEILYHGKTDTSFTGCERGKNGTTATAHAAGAMVYTRDASAVNDALGFNIAVTTDAMGVWSAITIPFYFLTKTIPRIVMMNFSFLSGELAIVSYIFFAAGAGFVITLALTLAGGRRV